MSRYKIEAKRKHEKEWTAWTETDEISKIEGFVNMIRENGYDAKVTDPEINRLEKMIACGDLLEPPCKIGQTVYSVITFEEENDELPPLIEEWQVKTITFDGVKWYASGDYDEQIEVGSQWCKITRAEAEMLLKDFTEREGGENDLN